MYNFFRTHNGILYIFLMMIVVGLMSCKNSDRLLEPTVSSAEDWRAKIEALNSKYAQKVGMQGTKNKINKYLKAEATTSKGSGGGENTQSGDGANGKGNDQKVNTDKSHESAKKTMTVGIVTGMGGAAAGYLIATQLIALTNPVGIFALALGFGVVSATTSVSLYNRAKENESEIEKAVEEYQNNNAESQDLLNEESLKNELIDWTITPRTVFDETNEIIKKILGPRIDLPDYIRIIFQDAIRNKIEICDPINVWYDFQGGFNDAIGVDVGPKINFTITQLLTNPDYAEMEIRDALYAIYNDYGLANDYEMEQLSPLFFDDRLWDEMHNLCNEAYNSNEIEERIKSISGVVDLNTYFDISFSLDKATRLEYADAYTRVVNDAWICGELSEEEATLINGCISAAYYENLLWRPVVETPYTTDMRVAFSVENNTVYYCDEDKLNVLLASGEASYWGVPHFVRNCVTEIYFYGDASDGYSLPDVSSITVDENTKFEFDYGQDGFYYFLAPGEYPISHLEQFDARYIKSYDYVNY